MDENTVEQVSRIEAETDRIVALAAQRVRQIEESFEPEVADLRRAREDELRRKVHALNRELSEQSSSQIARIEERMKEALRRLESVEPDAQRQALDLILKHLRGNGACP